MIKIILATLFSVLLLVIAGVVFYWRDIKYNPSGQDFLIFFGLIPFSITLLILTPMFIKKFYKLRQEKIAQKKAEAEQSSEEQINTQEQMIDQIEWVQLKVFSATSLSALGENGAHIELLQDVVSPKLDQQLINHYDLSTLSFRIEEIDDAVDENNELLLLSKRQGRIMALIQRQLAKNEAVLSQIATHLKNSALFYDAKLAHEYRMHPAWIDPNSEYKEEESERVIETVPRLNRLNIHIILPENLLHVWDENFVSKYVNDFLTGLGIISQQFDTQYHYWGETTAYNNWIKLLKQFQYLDSEVSFFIVVDSEIDQETLKDHSWGLDKYIPSEYVSTCCMTSAHVELQNLVAIKDIRIALNSDQASKTLKELNLEKASQFEQDAPFVLILDDPTEFKLPKKLSLNFAESMIEEHHYLYSKNSLGHTQSLSKIFGFMLSLHFKDELYGYVYSAEHRQTQVVVGTEFV